MSNLVVTKKIASHLGLIALVVCINGKNTLASSLQKEIETENAAEGIKEKFLSFAINRYKIFSAVCVPKEIMGIIETTKPEIYSQPMKNSQKKIC
jgi:hypothetical protein